MPRRMLLVNRALAQRLRTQQDDGTRHVVIGDAARPSSKPLGVGKAGGLYQGEVRHRVGASAVQHSFYDLSIAFRPTLESRHMPRTDNDTWNLATSVGATATINGHADTAAHVTMPQRFPTYVLPVPSKRAGPPQGWSGRTN